MRASLFVLPLAAVAFAVTRPASAQQTMAPYVSLHEPSLSACRTLPRPRAGTSYCVAGEAFDPAGVAKVTANGVEARLGPDTTRFRQFFALAPTADSGQATVEVVMTGKGGISVAHRYNIMARHEAGLPDYMLVDLSPRVLGGDSRSNVAVAPPPPAAPPLTPATGSVAAAPPSAPAGGAVPPPAAAAQDATSVAPAAADSGSVAAAASAAPAPAASAAEGANAYVQIITPAEWAGVQTRGLTVAPRNAVRVEGLAQLPSGVLRVELNGVRASLAPDPGGAVRFVGYAAPAPGSTDVEVVVRGNSGPPLVKHYALNPAATQVSAPGAAPLVAGAGFRGRRYAVVVGISQYADTAVSGLQFADSDARAFYDFLRSSRAGGGGFAEADVKLLLNQQATYREIRSALFTFLKASTPADQVVIYFAGHGAPDPQRPSNLYLLPYDTERSDIAGTGFPMDDVVKAVHELYARDILVITDACHSAGVGGQVATRGMEANAINDVFLQQLAASTGGLAIFTASGANQLSQEDVRWGGGHGVFTYHLLQALAGAADEDGDHIITLTEMMEYTRSHVRADTRNAQIPTIGQTAYDPFWPMSIAADSSAGPRLAAAEPQAAPAAEARTVAAVPAVATGSQMDAIGKFRQAVEQFPRSAVYRASLGRALRDAGSLAEAEGEFSQAVALEGGNATYRYELGVTLHRAGKLDQATAQLEEAGRIDNRNASVFNEAGAVHLDAGRMEEAVDRLRRAVRLEPGNAGYHRDLGRALDRSGKPGDAAAEYRLAVQIAPDSAVYRRALAASMQASGRAPEAIAELRAAVLARGSDPENHYALGTSLRAAGKPDSAAIELREAARLAPRNAAYRYQLGTLLRDMGRVADALPELREAARLSPDSVRYHSDLGILLTGAGQAPEAVEQLRRSVRLDSASAFQHGALAQALKAAGLPQEAVSEFQAAIRLAPGDARLHYEYGVFLRDLGTLEDALRELQQAVTLDGSVRDYREALNAVRRRVGH